MQKAELPLERYFWHEVARPGHFRHITLEEWSAAVWGLESRIHRLEIGTRCLQVGDNAAQICSAAKGRSSVRRVNRFRRQAAVVEAAGDLAPFWLRESTKGTMSVVPHRSSASELLDMRRLTVSWALALAGPSLQSSSRT